MKNILLAIVLLSQWGLLAQKPCEIDANVTDSLGTYKATKQHLVYERNFAGNATHLFFALSTTNGVLAVEAQLLQRSQDFLKASCFDAASKIYLQLNNGKIITLLYSGNGGCGSLVRSDDKTNNRILSGTFVFTKDNFEELKSSPVTYIRIKFAGETVDYPFKTSFISELDNQKYEPERYFIDFIGCVQN
jgi:hypothetical protein